MKDMDVLFKKLRHASNNGFPHLAITFGREYCEINQNKAPAWLYLGRSLAEVALYDESEHALMMGLSLCDVNKRYVILTHLGHLYVLKGSFQQAETYFRLAYEESPLEAEERVYLGEVLFKAGRLSDAEEVLHEIIKNGNESMHLALYLLGTVIAAQGRFTEAKDFFAEAVTLDPQRKNRKTLREIELLIAHMSN